MANLSCGATGPRSRSAASSISAEAVGTASLATKESAPAPARSHEVALLDRKALGPFVARDAAGGLVAWIMARDRGDGQDLVVVPLAPDGAPLRDARAVARVPREVTALVVQPTGGPQRGWLIAWSALADRGESLSVLGIAADGTAHGTPGDVQRTSDHIKWLTLVSTPRGALCIWAEETASANANMLTVPLDPDGKLRGMPARIASGIAGWQAVSAGEGAALALVSAGPSDDRAASGTLAWLRVDSEGRPLGRPVAVINRPSVSGDVDVVELGGRWLLAWTDRTGQDAQIVLAAIDATGRVEGPAPAMSPVGGCSLVALASGGHGTAALAWDEPRGHDKPTRELHLAAVSAQGDLAARSVTSLEVASGTTTELVPDGSGYALLTSARACLADMSDRACVGPIVPTVLRFGDTLEPSQAEPLFVGTGGRDPAVVAWDLRCEAERHCSVLAAPSQFPTPVYSVDVIARTSPFAVPLTAALPPDAPRVTGLATLASGQPYADLGAVKLGDATLVAALSESREGPDVRRRSSARITLFCADDAGHLLDRPRVLTTRAVAVGGVAMALGGRTEDDAALAWVARDAGDPEVHLARIDARGHTVREVRLTQTEGEASDVALAWAGDGWLVAWVDGRMGNGEVYAAKVDRELKRTAGDQRLTHAPGDADDVAVAVQGDVAWVAWSDPRDNPREGVADIFVMTLHAADATRASDDVRVLATDRHSRTPWLLPSTNGDALLGWIEDAPSGLEGPGAAMIARIDRTGHVAATPVPLLFVPGERPTGIVLARELGGARAVVSHAGREGVDLDAVGLTEDGAPSKNVFRLLELDAPPSFDVAFRVAGDAIVFDDVGASSGEHRVRRASILWKR
ncbi:MAG: hypothetical protein ABSC94_09380 [Polyangiaceae bacterium]